MKPRTLRRIANQYGVVGLLLVGAYLVAQHLWKEKRLDLLIATVIPFLLAAVIVPRYSATDYSPPYVHFDTQSLPPLPLEKQILANGDPNSQTAEVRGLIHEFAWAIEQQDRDYADRPAGALCYLFKLPEWETYNEDGPQMMHAIIGQIYLEHAWLPEAEREFRGVLAVVPCNRQSISRQMATYGLAHTSALRGSYSEALTWLTRGPEEYVTRCGNGIEANEVANHPLETVWTAASRPFPIAEAKLLAILGGRYTPVASPLNGVPSTTQKQHAAAEAGLTLGCLYAKAGRQKEAEKYWNLVASNPTYPQETVDTAKALRAHPQ